MQVLTEPRSALCKQYTSLLAMSNTRLCYTRAALRAVARRAMTKGTGTRGLRSILEQLLTDAMFEVRMLRGGREHDVGVPVLRSCVQIPSFTRHPPARLVLCVLPPSPP